MEKIIKQAAGCFHKQSAAYFYIDFCDEQMYAQSMYKNVR